MASGGADELMLRVSGIVAFVAAAPAVWLAARRVTTPPGALLALSLVYLAPAMVVLAVDIRPYPLFFCLSCWALYAYVRIATTQPRDIPDLWLVTVLLILASYTHFFGIVLAFCVYLALLVLSISRRQSLWPILLAGTLFALCCVGLVPFVIASVGVPAGPESVPDPVQVVVRTARLAYRLVVHGTHLPLGLPILALAALASVILFAVAAFIAWKTQRLAVVLPLVIGFAVLPVAGLAVAQFNPLSSNYNLWLVPCAALFLAMAFGARRKLVVWSAGAALITIQLAAIGVLLSRPVPWTHGPGEWIAAQIPHPETTLVIHDGSSPDWGHGYFPILHLTSGSVVQLLRMPDGDWRILPSGLVALPPDFAETAFERLVLIRTEAMTSEQFVSLPQGRPDCGFAAPQPSPTENVVWQWEQKHRCGLAAAAISIGTRSAP
jgi:hypothetical protein